MLNADTGVMDSGLARRARPGMTVFFHFVMAGLDPAIHLLRKNRFAD
jgi:hypothetical protein